ELLREQKTYDFSFDSDNFNPFTKAMFIINSTLYGNSHIQTSGVLSEPEGKIIVEEFTDDHFKANFNIVLNNKVEDGVIEEVHITNGKIDLPVHVIDYDTDVGTSYY